MLISSQLTKDLGGRVIAPDDPEYDEARTVFLGAQPKKPGQRPGRPVVARQNGCLVWLGGGVDLSGDALGEGLGVGQERVVA
jgi:hypothetical protein